MLAPVTALYAALNGLVGMALFAHVGRTRGKVGVSLNDGGDTRLIEANRRHMNWVENVPFILLLIALAELNGAPRPWLHALGLVLLVCRIVHPFGVSASTANTLPRMIGAGGTVLTALAAIGTLFWQALLR